ncbi:MAG TPA: tetratricopeptide repeat protein, partial [Verrucomicrobium sp.]|nr:tetratricopeptide repeat protein [Verrucomicrobium sp.]
MERKYKLNEGHPTAQRVGVPAGVLDKVRQAYEAGRYLDAYAHVLELGSPLQSWRGHAAQTLGARLATNLSAERLGDLLITRAWREAPRDAETLLQYGYRCLERQGPMSAWELLAHPENCENLTPALHADHLALRADIACTYRDFNTAGALMKQALEMDPASPWLLIGESRLLQAQEKRELALDKLDEALSLRPWYRPAVQYRGRLLHLLNRRDEAIQFLSESLSHLQSSHVALQLMGLKREVDDHAGVMVLLDQYEAWSPLLNPLQKEMLAARRADALYLQKEFEAAAAQAELVSGKYYESFARQLHTATGTERRVRLPVNFVLQGHRTCGPATLALIAQHWQHAARQEQIVQAICYDGTYDYSERQWCEDNGFTAREFQVTWDSLKLLIDAGVPFALATVEVGSAHMQTVIGYDEIRQTLFIQDPGEPHYRELKAVEFLEEYRLTGPRGMAVVPADRRVWLQNLPLPDAALYDVNYAFNRAIAGHRRQEAAPLLDEMASAHPRHRLTLFARLSLAAFDGNTQERQQVLQDMLEEHPDDMRVLYWHLQSLREVGRPGERIALLRRVIPMEKAHHSFLKELAVELAEDHRHRDEARRLLWWAHRCSPADSAVLSSIGVWKWRGQQQRHETLDYFRFAASLSDKVEIWSVQWFNACVALNRTDEALAWLRQRFESYGSQSAGPATTLALCLERLCRTEESLAVIDEAVNRRPEDGELLVHAARLAARFGKKYEAQLRLEQARHKCPPGQRLRAEAAIAARDGDHPQLLALWQQILQSEPLSLEAHQSVAHALALLEGREAGTRHLSAVCASFPHHYDLNQARISWIREHSVEAALPAALAMQEHFPEDAWLQRELALIYHALGRFADALQHASAAVRVDPDSPHSLVTMATALEASGRAPEAAECCRKAIRHDVNFAPALSLLTDCVTGSDARRQELEFIRSEMVAQVLNGETLHLYRALAYGLVEPAQLMGQLREVWQARPDLWEAWSVLASQSQDAGEVAEAARLAEEASRKFPLLPGAWRDLGLIKRLQGNNEEALAAFRRATELNPDWDQAWAELAQLQEDLGHAGEAMATLRSALKRMPRESSLLMLLALLLWRSGEREEPWKMLEDCVRHEPLRHQAWRVLANWSPQVHKEKELETLARAMTLECPGQAQTWLILAQILGAEAVDERLQAIDRAIEIQPGSEEAYDFKAMLLADHGRFEEAGQALKSGPWKQGLPASLAGRSAWLMVQQGKTQEGMNALRKVLEKHKDFRWGWERYYELAEHLGQRVDMRKAAQELTRLSPRDPGVYCRAAMVELQAGGDEKAAI